MTGESWVKKFQKMSRKEQKQHEDCLLVRNNPAGCSASSHIPLVRSRGNRTSKLCGLSCDWPRCGGICEREATHVQRGLLQHICGRCGRSVNTSFNVQDEDEDAVAGEEVPEEVAAPVLEEHTAAKKAETAPAGGEGEMALVESPGSGYCCALWFTRFPPLWQDFKDSLYAKHGAHKPPHGYDLAKGTIMAPGDSYFDVLLLLKTTGIPAKVEKRPESCPEFLTQNNLQHWVWIVDDSLMESILADCRTQFRGVDHAIPRVISDPVNYLRPPLPLME